tara:strand:- start:22 stop:666 length:645 start_codon:yes stop_codon:yes gene_type:complete
MESYHDGILMLNWIAESQVLENQDYGFLTNVYLEVIHLAEEMPNTPEGRKVQYELIRVSSQISNCIDDVEDQIDGSMLEYFESTTDEIMEEEEEEETNVEYRKTITIQREINIVTSWTIDRVEGPIGEVPRDNVYDFSEFDVDEITSAVEQWASDQGIEETIDMEQLRGEEEIVEELSFEFDDELAPITVYVTVRQTYTWDGDDNYDSNSWEEA